MQTEYLLLERCLSQYMVICMSIWEKQEMHFECVSKVAINTIDWFGKCFIFICHISVYGNNIVGSSGQIASPLWPRNYPHNSNYQWTITVNTTQVIRGQLQQMDIEEFRSCGYDKLKVNLWIPLWSRLCLKCRSNKTKLLVDPRRNSASWRL